MEHINKQNFLAELSKLLTFMYEEDRQEALAMYSSMFDEAEDEQKLIQLLMSPTRQAVIVARAYDAKDRKLQVTSQSREGSGSNDGETPDFAVAIEKVRKEAEERDILRAGVSDDQLSFFEEEKPAEPVAAEPEVPSVEEAKEPGEEISDGFSKKEVPETEDFLVGLMDEEPMEIEEIPAEERDAGIPEEPENEPVNEAETLPELPEVPEVGEVGSAEEPSEPFDYTKDIPDDDGFYEPSKEAMVGWLTLFVIFAIPIGFVACVLMIVLALAFLALAAAAAGAGVFAIRSLFSGFAVLADILLVGGSAIAALALALLFLWTAVWCLFGALPGIVRGIIELGRSWCYKEVSE